MNPYHTYAGQLRQHTRKEVIFNKMELSLYPWPTILAASHAYAIQLKFRLPQETGSSWHSEQTDHLEN